MKCTLKTALLVGPVLGFCVFVVVMFTRLALPLYYLSGAWLVDRIFPALDLHGEEYIPIAFLVTLIICIFTTTVYCVLACKFLSKNS